MKCVQCGSQDIMNDVRVVERGEGDVRRDLSLETYRHPEAWIFKDPITVPIHAKVCGECGFVMMSAEVSEVEKLKAGKPLK